MHFSHSMLILNNSTHWKYLSFMPSSTLGCAIGPGKDGDWFSIFQFSDLLRLDSIFLVLIHMDSFLQSLEFNYDANFK